MSNFGRYQISGPAQRKMEEFSDAFQDAFALTADIGTWAAELGYVASVDGAAKITFPIPLDAAGFHEFDGDAKFRDMYGRTVSVVTKLWQDGIKIDSRKIKNGEILVDWAGGPGRMVDEWRRLPNIMVAAMLESGASANGPILDLYKDPDTNAAGTLQLFSATHLVNPIKPVMGTFNNILTATTATILNGTFYDSVEQYFRTLAGPNGKPLGTTLEGGALLVPPALANLTKRSLENDYLIHAVDNAGKVDAVASVVAAERGDNRWKGVVKRVVAPELTQAGVFYVLAGGKPGLYPWMAAQDSALEERVWDETSDEYKTKNLYKLSYQGEANCGAAMPQGIVKVNFTP